MAVDLDPIATLRRTDPTAGRPVPDRPPLDELAARPVASHVRPGRRSRAVVLAAAALLVVLLAGAAIVVATDPDDERQTPLIEVPTSPSTPAAPDVVAVDLGREPITLDPAEPAAPALLALADEIEDDGNPRPAGMVSYRRSVEWTTTSTEAERSLTAHREAHQIETWTSPGAPLSYRTEDVSLDASGTGAPVPLPFPSGRTELLSTSSVREPDVWELPADADALVAILQARQEGAPTPAGTFGQAVFVLDLPLTGPDRATLFRALASIEGVEHRGTVVDRIGRDGVAFSIATERSGRPAELVAVLDPDTGELLATEEVGFDLPVILPEDRPGALDSSTVLTAAWVAGHGQRPA
ncbi:MAG TPA: hypothetical protein VK507_08300 [Iamia sp.]|nr:hypothetical protein [Iamia sp.]